MSINATYTESYYQNKLEYICNIQNTDFGRINNLSLNARHINGKSNDDVTMLSFMNCNFNKIPQFLLTFPKLKIFVISRSNLKRLTMADMDAYRNIEIIDISKTGFRFLPGNLFTGFEKLREIYFNNNQLDIIEPNILDGLNNVKIADFNFNFYYNEVYFSAEMSLKEFRKILIQKFLGVNPGKVVNYIENLQKDIQEYKEENENLSEKVDDLDVYQPYDYGYMKYYNELCELAEENARLGVKVEELESNPIKSIHADLNAFIQDETTKDFKIIIDSHEFPVHKFLLAARSTTLAEILKNNPEVENLNLVDIYVETFEIILKFLYTDELPSEDGTNFIHLFAAAGKLKIQKLVDYAAEKLLEMPDLENPLEVLLLSNKYGKEDLKQKAFREVKKKYPKMELKDELANDLDKITEFIKIMKIKEEADKKMKELFNK